MSLHFFYNKRESILMVRRALRLAGGRYDGFGVMPCPPNLDGVLWSDTVIMSFTRYATGVTVGKTMDMDEFTSNPVKHVNAFARSREILFRQFYLSMTSAEV